MNGENVGKGRTAGYDTQEYIRLYLDNMGIAEATENAKFMFDVFETIAKNQYEYRQLVDHFYEAIIPNSYAAGFLCSVDFLNETIKEVSRVVKESQVEIDTVSSEMKELQTKVIGKEENPFSRIKLVDKLLYVLYSIFDKYSDALKQYIMKELEKEEFDYEGYCREVIKSLDISADQSKNTNEEFNTESFMPVLWERSDGETVLIGDNLEELNINMGVKSFQFADTNIRLVGPAGEGKTWAMKYLQYRCCQEYLDSNGEKGSSIAVMVELKCFNDAEYENMTIDDCIMEKLHIQDVNLYQKVMNTGKVRVFLDGYNEIFDEMKKRNVLRFATRANSRYRIVISDREISSGTLQYFKVYKLLKIRQEQILWYFRKHIGIDSQNEFENDGRLAWVRNDDVRVTPFMLSVLMDLAKNTVYPAKNVFDRYYLKYLLNREVIQQSESMVLMLNVWLQTVAMRMKAIGEMNYRLPTKDARDILKDLVPNQTETTIINNFMIWADNIPIFGSSDEKGYLQFKNMNYRDYYADDTMFDEYGKIKNV